MSGWFRKLRRYLRLALGMLLNLAGVPGIVRECEYHDPSAQLTVRVRKYGSFTVISVNDFDIHFSRLTGTIDSIGSSEPAVDIDAS